MKSLRHGTQLPFHAVRAVGGESDRVLFLRSLPMCTRRREDRSRQDAPILDDLLNRLSASQPGRPAFLFADCARSVIQRRFFVRMRHFPMGSQPESNLTLGSTFEELLALALRVGFLHVLGDATPSRLHSKVAAGFADHLRSPWGDTQCHYERDDVHFEMCFISRWWWCAPPPSLGSCLETPPAPRQSLPPPSAAVVRAYTFHASSLVG